MPYDVRSFTVPFGTDSGLNLFGDYNALVRRVYQNQSTKEVFVSWCLISSKGGFEKELLSRDDINAAVASLFSQQATVRDEPQVEDLSALTGVKG